MARTSTSTRKTTPQNTETATQTVEMQAEMAKADASVQAPAQKERRTAYKVKDIDPNMFVPVRNGFNGKLIYVSRKTGERYVWEHFGDEQDMELRELRAAKTSYKTFFESNWFLIDDPDVIEYLGVERYYKDALTYEEFDTLFELDADAIAQRIGALSKGQRASLKYRARQLIRDGKIDSIKVINTLERLLDTELIERQGERM